MFKVIFIAVLIMFTCVIASAKNDAAVYLKDGTVEQGELVWLQGDKVYLNKNGEL